MIINITLKDPDGVYESIQYASRREMPEGLSVKDQEQLEASRHLKIAAALKPWIEFGEYVRLQIDTEAKTATVILNK